VTRDKVQLGIIIVGLISIGLGVQTMLLTPTLILPPWFLVLLYIPFLLGVSFVLGLLTKKLIKTKWTTLTMTAIFTTIVCLTFYIYEYRQTLTIIVPDNFAGTAYLIVTKEPKNDFELNESGVGYIKEETYNNGFQPKVFKGGQEITEKIRGYGIGSGSYKGQQSIKFVTFDIPGKISDWKEISFRDLIESNAIDTTRIKLD
jgi:hypothetical protein